MLTVKAQAERSPVSQADPVQVLAGAVAVPDAHALLAQQIRVGGAGDEPQKLLDDPCNACWVEAALATYRPRQESSGEERLSDVKCCRLMS